MSLKKEKKNMFKTEKKGLKHIIIKKEEENFLPSSWMPYWNLIQQQQQS